MTFKPTPEQQLIIETARSSRRSFAVVARAGAAKTTTLEWLCGVIPPSEQTLALAFNVKIKKEMAARFPSHVDVRTLNGLGHRAWGSTVRKRLILDDRKSGRLVQSVIDSFEEEKGELSPFWASARQLVDCARNVGLVPEGTKVKPSRRLLPDEHHVWDDLITDNDIESEDELLTIKIARQALLLSIEEAFLGTIDFSDQIYMPTLFGGNFKRYDNVLVDEAQDLSAINHIMLKLSLKFRTGRLIAVGDPLQAIYGFRGAMSGSLTKLIEDYNLEVLPLTTTFRCAKAIVEEAKTRAPDLTAAPWAEEGEVRSLTKYSPSLFPYSCAVICRNNAPLISLALRLITAGKGVNFLGGNLFKELKSIIGKTCPDPETSAEVAFARLDSWRSKEITKLRALNRDSLVSKREDQFACIIALFDAEGVENVKGALARMDDLEQRSGEITLCTGHKSKGLEWEEVFILDPFRIPSHYARRAADNGRPEQLEQEYNLLYVMRTRAKKRLTYINLENYDPTLEEE